MTHPASVGLLLLGILGPLACSGAAPPASEVLSGVWGGEGIRVTLTATGGTVEFECASASIEGPFAPGSDRRFHAKGMLSLRTGGPAVFPPPTEVKPQPVEYQGRIDGRQMHLVILRSEPRAGEPTRWEYRLEQGRRGVLEECL